MKKDYENRLVVRSELTLTPRGSRTNALDPKYRMIKGVLKAIHTPTTDYGREYLNGGIC
jgi:hypothetical protein